MPYVALMRRVLPGKMVITRKDYEKLELRYLHLTIPSDIASERELDGRIYFDPKYFSRLLDDEDLVSIKLSSQTKIGAMQGYSQYYSHYNSSIDMVVCKISDPKYKQFLELVNQYKTLLNTDAGRNLDYNKLEEGLLDALSLIQQNKPLASIRRKINASQKQISQAMSLRQGALGCSSIKLHDFIMNLDIVDVIKF